MPIYAYRCSACGHAKDVLQKLSDPALATCPACGADAFAKQVTAAGFQLKGSGWYATDFKGGPAKTVGGDNAKPESGGSAEGKPDSVPAPAAAAAPAPAASCGGACACH